MTDLSLTVSTVSVSGSGSHWVHVELSGVNVGDIKDAYDLVDGDDLTEAEERIDELENELGGVSEELENLRVDYEELTRNGD